MADCPPTSKTSTADSQVRGSSVCSGSSHPSVASASGSCIHSLPCFSLRLEAVYRQQQHPSSAGRAALDLSSAFARREMKASTVAALVDVDLVSTLRLTCRAATAHARRRSARLRTGDVDDLPGLPAVAHRYAAALCLRPRRTCCFPTCSINCTISSSGAASATTAEVLPGSL